MAGDGLRAVRRGLGVTGVGVEQSCGGSRRMNGVKGDLRRHDNNNGWCHGNIVVL